MSSNLKEVREKARQLALTARASLGAAENLYMRVAALEEETFELWKQLQKADEHGGS